MHKQIIAEAWKITNEHKKKLFKYWFFPSFFTVIIWVVYISYQIQAFRHSIEFWWNWDVDFFWIVNTVWEWIVAHKWLSSFLIFFSFFSFLMYIFSPIICDAVLIHYIAQIKLWKTPQWWLSVAFNKFFHLFELSAMLSPFHFITFITESSFIIRNFWLKTWMIILPILTLILIIWVVIHFLFAFSQQDIVLQDKEAIWSIRWSTSLVLWNIRDAFFLWGILLVIIVRIFLNMILILFIPLVFIFITQLFTLLSLNWLWIIIWLIVWVWLIWASAYLLAWFSIFTVAVWTISYIYFKKNETESKIDINKDNN